MQTVRQYGDAPFRVAVIHGGLGAAGSVAPVAGRLSETRGVLESIQTATILDSQVEELRLTLERHATQPLVLIGHSWGGRPAWRL